jgi:2-polyprenyl-3-methyl-5-hydroxy-6-metoxy-1,4-benzoquinol methylase
MPETILQSNDLDEFKAFIYNSYLETHPVYTNKIDDEFAGRYWILKDFLAKALPSDKTAVILDYGCGDGKLLSVAQELGYANLVGVDHSKSLLDVAARRTKATLHHQDGLEFLRSAASTSFDVVIAFDVFEHLTRPQLLATCREIARILKPSGRLLLHVPNGASPDSGRQLWGDLTHERPFTKASLGQVLLPLGFEHIAASEAAPVAHGWKSLIRAFLWRIIRAATIFRLAVESGEMTGHVLTSNIFVTARKTAATRQPESGGETASLAGVGASCAPRTTQGQHPGESDPPQARCLVRPSRVHAASIARSRQRSSPHGRRAKH